ncbi:MAG: methyltransferase domain-containing protein [Oscillatoria sp. Prado101]|jgi:predicted SAM-dependent methyltransferase|nr:methyltransferase domain-containing protein [Oscillatoria sp. Prado101]
MVVQASWLKYQLLNALQQVGLRRDSQLKQHLIQTGRTRWLDIGGTTDSFAEGFMCLNMFPVDAIPAEFSEQYYSADLDHLDTLNPEDFGQFDLVRMQHVFEHFSFENGVTLLKFCAQLLKPDGYFLMTVPDLRIHVSGYLSQYRQMKFFSDYAKLRVPDDAPASFIFSIHAHQTGYAPEEIPGQVHKWCYDYEGLKYQFNQVKSFKHLKRIDLLDSWAEIPFTHNRPLEDLCVIAQKQG